MTATTPREESQQLRVGDVVRVPIQVKKLISVDSTEKKKSDKGKNKEDSKVSTENTFCHAVAVVRAISDDASAAVGHADHDPMVRVDLGPGFHNAGTIVPSAAAASPRASMSMDEEENRMVWLPLSQLAPVLVKQPDSKRTVMNVEATAAEGDVAELTTAPEFEDDNNSEGVTAAEDYEAVCDTSPLDRFVYRLVAPVQALLEWHSPIRGMFICLLAAVIVFLLTGSGDTPLQVAQAMGHQAHNSDLPRVEAEIELLQKNHDLLSARYEEDRKDHARRVAELTSEKESLQRDAATLEAEKISIEQLKSKSTAKMSEAKIQGRTRKIESRTVALKEAMEKLEVAQAAVHGKEVDLNATATHLETTKKAVAVEGDLILQQQAELEVRKQHQPSGPFGSFDAGVLCVQFTQSLPLIRSLFWLLVFSTPGSRLATPAKRDVAERLMKRFFQQNQIGFFCLVCVVLSTCLWTFLVAGGTSVLPSLNPAPLTQQWLSHATLGDVAAFGLAVTLLVVRVM